MPPAPLEGCSANAVDANGVDANARTSPATAGHRQQRELMCKPAPPKRLVARQRALAGAAATLTTIAGARDGRCAPGRARRCDGAGHRVSVQPRAAGFSACLHGSGHAPGPTEPSRVRAISLHAIHHFLSCMRTPRRRIAGPWVACMAFRGVGRPLTAYLGVAPHPWPLATHATFLFLVGRRRVCMWGGCHHVHLPLCK